jgi:PAS domain S-box-containing protein
VLGYDPGEVEPSLDIFMSHVYPDDRATIENNRKAALAGRYEYDVEYRFTRKDGQLRHGRSLGKVQLGPDGAPLFMFGAIQDITDRKIIEQSLENALAEKEAMLLEIHHRVKNNLQVMMSLLDMSRNRARGEEAKAMIEEVISKITSMVLIHNKLYLMDDFKHIDIGDFASTLCANLAQVYASPGITQEMDADDILLSIENAMPVGLVLNELISNAFKHAFVGGKGTIRIVIGREGSRVRVEISDNGRGLPPEIDPATAKSLGLKLVRDLVEIRLGGTLEISSNGGTLAAFSFNEPCAE